MSLNEFSIFITWAFKRCYILFMLIDISGDQLVYKIGVLCCEFSIPLEHIQLINVKYFMYILLELDSYITLLILFI